MDSVTEYLDPDVQANPTLPCEIPSMHHHVTHSQASDLPTRDEPHWVLIHPFQHTRLAKS